MAKPASELAAAQAPNRSQSVAASAYDMCTGFCCPSQGASAISCPKLRRAVLHEPRYCFESCMQKGELPLSHALRAVKPPRWLPKRPSWEKQARTIIDSTRHKAQPCVGSSLSGCELGPTQAANDRTSAQTHVGPHPRHTWHIMFTEKLAQRALLV